MIEILVISIIFFFIAIYIISKNKANVNTTNNIYSSEYYRGLNYLLNNEDDKALKIFTDLIDVDSSTIETHLALGGVYRRRGEFDKAILIHQNLLSRPKLDKSIKNQTLYELSKDFFSAGLYDKSEKILLNLKQHKSYFESCNEYLLLIYELSKDWDNAIKFTKNLKQPNIRKSCIDVIVSHYYCEKANDYKNDNQLNKSITVLRKAIDINNKCKRAYMTLFEFNIHSNPGLALDNLEILLNIDSIYLIILSNEIVSLSTIHQDNNLDKRIYDIILKFSNDNNFSPTLYEFMFNITGYDAPHDYLDLTKTNIFTNIFNNLYLAKNSSDNTSLPNNDLLALIKNNFLTYNCSNCGYTAKNHIWQCPSCNHWETIKPITISERVSYHG
jgi:lipopolysaccharide biosynthesis regulator YciM